MSAIFGILRFDGADVVPRDLARLQAASAGRGGPAGVSTCWGPIGLGAAIDPLRHVDRHEAQPLHDDAAELTLVANTRLDDRPALAAALGIEPGDLPTVPDSALILAAYRKWGEDCAAHLLGDFVFAIWNGRTRRLFIACDHMAQRSVHYHIGAGFVAFAPTPQALWTLAEVPRTLSDEAIGRRLMHAMDQRPGETMFPGINTLPGGHGLIVDATGAATLSSYWQPAADPAHVGRDEAYYVAAYRRVLGEAAATAHPRARHWPRANMARQ